MAIFGNLFKKKDTLGDVRSRISGITPIIAAIEEKHRHRAAELSFKTDKEMANTAFTKLEDARTKLHHIEGLLQRREQEGALALVDQSKKSFNDYKTGVSKLKTFQELPGELDALQKKLDNLKEEILAVQ